MYSRYSRCTRYSIYTLDVLHHTPLGSPSGTPGAQGIPGTPGDPGTPCPPGAASPPPGSAPPARTALSPQLSPPTASPGRQIQVVCQNL